MGDSKAAGTWKARAEKRRGLINRYCLGEDGVYYDYDFVNGRRSTVVSGAVFSLLYAGIPDAEQARILVKKALGRLEFEYGIAVCEDEPYDYDYQWSYPNTWPPVVYLAIRGLDAYGYRQGRTAYCGEIRCDGREDLRRNP